MAKYTDNCNLILPEQNEAYNVDIANTNNSIIDAKLGNKMDKVAGKGLSTNDFTNEYKKKIDVLQKLYKFKGSVETLTVLEGIEEKSVGDVWRCNEDNNNYCWNGTELINIGSDIDLTDYALKTDLNQLQDNIEKAINERNIITATFSSNHVIASSSSEKVNLDTSVIEGDKLSLVNGSILIGKGVSKVKASSNINFQYITEGLKTVSFVKNGTTVIQNNTTISARTTISTSPVLIEVAEGDLLELYFTGVAEDTIRRSMAFSNVTVEVVN